jgi:hypothetical protein
MEFYFGDWLLSYFIIDDRDELSGMITIIISRRDRNTERLDRDDFSLCQRAYFYSLSYFVCREEVYIHCQR